MIPRGDVSAPSKPGYSFKIFFTFVLRCAKFRHWYFLLSALKKLSSNARSMVSCTTPKLNFFTSKWKASFHGCCEPFKVNGEIATKPKEPARHRHRGFHLREKNKKVRAKNIQNSMWKSASITFISRGSRFSCFYFDFAVVCNDSPVNFHTMGIFYRANVNCR